MRVPAIMQNKVVPPDILIIDMCSEMPISLNFRQRSFSPFSATILSSMPLLALARVLEGSVFGKLLPSVLLMRTFLHE